MQLKRVEIRWMTYLLLNSQFFTFKTPSLLNALVAVHLYIDASPSALPDLLGKSFCSNCMFGAQTQLLST